MTSLRRSCSSRRVGGFNLPRAEILGDWGTPYWAIQGDIGVRISESATFASGVRMRESKAEWRVELDQSSNFTGTGGGLNPTWLHDPPGEQSSRMEAHTWQSLRFRSPNDRAG